MFLRRAKKKTFSVQAALIPYEMAFSRFLYFASSTLTSLSENVIHVLIKFIFDHSPNIALAITIYGIIRRERLLSSSCECCRKYEYTNALHHNGHSNLISASLRFYIMHLFGVTCWGIFILHCRGTVLLFALLNEIVRLKTQWNSLWLRNIYLNRNNWPINLNKTFIMKICLTNWRMRCYRNNLFVEHRYRASLSFEFNWHLPHLIVGCMRLKSNEFSFDI